MRAPSPLQYSHLSSKIRVTFLLQMRSAFPRQHDLRVYKTYIQSLLLQSVQQYTDTSRRLFTRDSTVHQQPAQSTAYLDTHHDHLWWLQKVLQYTHGDHTPDKIKLRLSQMIVSPIMRTINSTKVQSISKSVSVNHGISKTLEGVL